MTVDYCTCPTKTESWFPELDKYVQGSFIFKKGDNLKALCKNLPDLPGIFYVVSSKNGFEDVVYIGSSGPLPQSGDFGNQTLRRRIHKKHNKIKREDFFNQMIEKEQLDYLHIYWLVTIDVEISDLPTYVQGFLMQQYYNVYLQLPEWNKEY